MSNKTQNDEGVKACFEELLRSVTNDSDRVFQLADKMVAATDTITEALPLGPLTGSLAAHLAATVAECYVRQEHKMKEVAGTALSDRREELCVAVGMLVTGYMRMSLLLASAKGFEGGMH